MSELDRQQLETVIAAAGERLEGSWLLIGGALVALWLEPRRITEDLDLIGIEGHADERYRLMLFAESLQLPVEAVNSAADFFVRRIPGWEKEIELFRAGTQGKIYRPSPTLFLLLKMGRLSEEDLADCEALLERCRAEALPVDTARVLTALDALPRADGELAARRARLRQRVLTKTQAE